MTSEEIKTITDKAKQICLVGIRGFDADIQQYTCKFISGEYCDCYNKYLKALTDETACQPIKSSELLIKL
jgi:hypothetical protein